MLLTVHNDSDQEQWYNHLDVLQILFVEELFFTEKRHFAAAISTPAAKQKKVNISRNMPNLHHAQEMHHSGETAAQIVVQKGIRAYPHFTFKRNRTSRIRNIPPSERTFYDPA